MTAPTHREKAERFRRLHEGSRCFVIPNPYDAGSARLLQSLGFEALATSSGACAACLAAAMAMSPVKRPWPTAG